MCYCSSNSVFAHRMFLFVAVATRPLRVEELAELLAFEFREEQYPYRIFVRSEDPLDELLSM